MSRAIVVAPQATSGASTRGGLDEDEFTAAPNADSYTDRLLKLIPGEVVAFYLSSTAALKSAVPNEASNVSAVSASGSLSVAASAPWVVFAFCILATYFYLRIVLKVVSNRQLAITVGAFCVWAFSLGYPFDGFAWYQSAYGGILLAAYTLVAPHIPLE
ncbi:MAG: hypothetical protein ACR2PZ_07660 [Pseudomonadales bacterium]